MLVFRNVNRLKLALITGATIERFSIAISYSVQLLEDFSPGGFSESQRFMIRSDNRTPVRMTDKGLPYRSPTLRLAK